MKHKRRTKALSWLLSVAMLVGLLPGLSLPARAEQEPVKYMDASVDPTTHAVTFTEKECTNYSVVTNSNYTWSDGWYVVKDIVTVVRGFCQGTVNLILCDGAKLTAQRGVITTGSTLNIYCQKEGTGELVAYGTFQNSKSAGIGGNQAGLAQAGPGGTVTINGGVITAIGGGQYAGIGGTTSNSGGTVTINGGTVNATGGSDGAGIGGGANGGGGTVTINGGTVEATGGSGAAGIGGGYNAGGGTVAIYGGTVTATGGSDAVGIGGGQMKTTQSTLILGEWMALFGGSTASSAVLVQKGNDGSYARATSMKVQIAPVPYQDATVDETTHAVSFTDETCTDYTTVTDSTTAVTWNSGWYVVSGTPEISSRITVTGTVHLILCDGATLTASKGIKTTGATLNIYGQSSGTGTLTATGGTEHIAGIGGGLEENGGTVTIHGGTVNATGGTRAAGIGGGRSGNGGTITIHGGTVNATGGQYAAGIGSGSSGNGGNVTINGGTVNANGGKDAAGIGGGAYAGGVDVTINGGVVCATGGNQYNTVGIGRGNVWGGSTPHGKLTLGPGMYLYKDSVSDDNAVKKNDDGDYARSTKMIVNNVSPHTHKLTYSYSKTAVTAVCDGVKPDFCEFPLVDGKHTATLTIAAPEKGGDPATADISGAAAFDETKISAITYETKQSDGTFAASAATPPNADGFHRASLTYTDGEGAHVISVTYGLNCITYGEAENGTIDGVKSAAVGAAITPTIAPATGYELDALTVAQKDNESVTVEIAADKSFVMPDYDVTVSATFKLKPFNIISGLTAGATMTAKVGENEVTTAKMGDSVALTITPAAGYTVNTVSVKDSAEGSVDVSGENGSYSFTMPASDVTVTATYNAIDYNVSVSGSIAHGTVMPSKTSAAHVGDEITLTVTPEEGYELGTLSVKDKNENDVAVTDNKFTMPASDVTVSATFTAIDYSVTIAESTNGTVTTATTGAVHIGDKITLTVTPAENYGVKTVTANRGTLVQTALNPETGVATYELTMGAGNATVTAEFAALTTYTVFYNASGSPDAVSVRLAGDTGNGYAMTNDAKLGNIDCWSTQIRAGAGVGSLSLSIKQSDETDWKTLDIPVVTDLTAPEQGAAVAIEGETDAFVVAFVWGEDTETQSRYYLVTSNTTSISVPNPADTGSETFSGWTYLVPSGQGVEGKTVTVDKAAGGNSTTVQLGEIKQTTIVNAIWTPKTYTVSFDTDNGGEKTTQIVTYGSSITLPDAPTKAGHEFVGWVLAKSAVEQVGGKTLQLSAGTAVDLNAVRIINDLSLKAKWRHVHSYVCLPLDHSAFGGAFEEFYGYKSQLHVRICTSMDDYTAEAHSFVNGKCACGASILDDKVTLTQYAGSTGKAIKAIRNSFVSISAPQKSGSQTFSKWQYSFNATTKNNGDWSDLTSARSIAFAIPNNMSTRAVYENETAKLSIRSFKYDNSHVAFQFDYSVPEGYTVVDGGLMWGDNVRMKFWDCTIKSFLGSQYEPSLRDAVSVFGGGTIASKMYNYQTINEPGLATPFEKPLKSFGRTGTVAVAWQPYTSDGYKDAIRAGAKVDGYNQSTYPTYAMGYIICKHSNGYVGFMTNAISATLERPSASHVAQISVSG